MRNLSIYLSALLVLSSPVHGLRHGSRQLRDQLAFPKYQVDFLNDLPLSQSDAERCRAVGVEAEDEFTHARFAGRKRLGEGDDAEQEQGQERLEIVPIKLPSLDGTHTHEYLCLMPSDNSTASQMAQEEEFEEVDPAQGWAALSHLDGKCLYTKQGWFTYSYCHDSHIRQFRQAPHQHPHPPGGFTPEEDQRYEAYTLGQATGKVSGQGQGQGKKKALPGAGAGAAAAAAAKPGAGTTSVDRLNHDHAVSYGLQPSSRYLVQRWSDGTRCDKTLRPREIEVQVHCSMTTTDTIYLVKELSICNYVMIIHTPHLCSLPGFRADHSHVDSAKVRCREVISDQDFERWETGEAVDMPFLTIGKEEGAAGTHTGAGETEGEGERAGGGDDETLGYILQEAGGAGPDDQVVLNDDDLRVALNLLSQHFKQAGGGLGQGDEEEEGEEESLFFTIDENGDEPVIIQAQPEGGAGGDGAGAGAGTDKDMIKKLVKQYLAQKGKPQRDSESEEKQEKKDKGRGKRDEL